MIWKKLSNVGKMAYPFVWRVFILLLFAPLVGCRPWYARSVKGWEVRSLPHDSLLVNEFHLVGDAGKWKLGDGMQALVARQINRSQAPGAVIFLGDNIYEWGLPDSASKDFAESNEYLQAQLNTTANYRYPVRFIAGNHDWAASYKMKPEGLRNLQNQARTVAAYSPQHKLSPEPGCPGPEAELLPTGWVLILLDTQWWMQTDREKALPAGCPCRTEAQVLNRLDSLLKTHADSPVLVVAHHPVVDNGPAGKRYTLRDHIFPLTAFNPHLWIPLPLIGSGVVAMRLLGKPFTDQTHPAYARLVKGLKQVLAQHPRVVYANGHEHNQQYHQVGTVHYIGTGSAAKRSSVTQGNRAEFVDTHRGYAVLRTYRNGETWVEYRAEGHHHDAYKVAYRRKLWDAMPTSLLPGR